MSLEELAKRDCVPCKGTTPMTKKDSEPFMNDFLGWQLFDGSIEKEFKFTSYLEGLDFALALGRIAESQDHHPDMLVKWRRVKVTLSTHVIKGLSMNDFIIAAKAELEYRKHASR